jgi:hypothetical protein
MMTLRQIERFWDGREFDRLVRELLTLRAEDSARLRAMLGGSLAAAALGLIRLDELNASHAPVTQKFVRRILASQTADGGWDNPLVTALCTRALLTSNGHGPAVDRAIAHLADLQKSDGSWPREPIRRLAADPFTTAFVLFTLGSSEAFRAAVRIEDAVTSLAGTRGAEMDVETKKLWNHAVMRANVKPRRIVASSSSAPMLPLVARDGIAA